MGYAIFPLCTLILNAPICWNLRLNSTILQDVYKYTVFGPSPRTLPVMYGSYVFSPACEKRTARGLNRGRQQRCGIENEVGSFFFASLLSKVGQVMPDAVSEKKSVESVIAIAPCVVSLCSRR